MATTPDPPSPRPLPLPIGRNWPHNINSPGVHTFQRPAPQPLIQLQVR